MTEKKRADGDLGRIRPHRRKVVTFADVVGPERAIQYAQEKQEADRRIAARRRELGGSAWALTVLDDYRSIVLPAVGVETE